jgi:pimeloyl-ACP methyl ester carboxylesterase
MSITIDSVRRTDGRMLEVMLGGEPAGYPLVLHHGTPTDATIFAGWDAPCQAHQLRLIAITRPGYSSSTRLVGRTVAAVADDVAAVLKWLGHARFVSAGVSGGGPHALACAALLPNRCAAAMTIAGVAPYTDSELDFLDGMGPENVVEYGAALEGEVALRAWMAENGGALQHVTGAMLAEAFGGLVPAVDKAVLVGGYADQLAGSLRRALAPGFDGWIDDDMAFTRDWGFDLGQIRTPVTVWQGDLDLMVPQAHGRALVQRIPGAVGRMVSGHGHISMLTSYRDELLDALRRSAGE